MCFGSVLWTSVLVCFGAIIRCLEETEFGKKSPLNSVYFLDGICAVCKTNDDLKWCLVSIKDCLLYQGCSTSDFSVRNLLGKNKQKGYVHLMLFKRQLLSYLCLDMVVIALFCFRSHSLNHNVANFFVLAHVYLKTRCVLGEAHMADHQWLWRGANQHVQGAVQS